MDHFHFWPNFQIAPDPTLPIGDGPGGTRGDAGGGASTRLASLRQAVSINGARGDSCMRGWDRG
jgi:hypothetical protein